MTAWVVVAVTREDYGAVAHLSEHIDPYQGSCDKTKKKKLQKL